MFSCSVRVNSIGQYLYYNTLTGQETNNTVLVAGNEGWFY